jgi:hypothetical protein
MTIPEPANLNRAWLGAVFSWVQSNFWWQLLSLTAVMGLAYPLSWLARHLLRDTCGTDPGVKGMLDVLEEILRRGSDKPHTYRITLFRAHRKRKLKMYERSGHRTLGSRTKFKINPDKEERNEGIAGRCWYREQVIVQSDLPDVSHHDAPPEDIRRYADLTFYDEHKVRKRRPRSRVLAGFPLSVNGHPWGALVLDSEDPSAFSSDTLASNRHIRPFLKAISQALRETH